MATIIIKKQQLVNLLETAMDLDIYVQPVSPMIPGENDNFNDSLDEIKDKIEELQNMAKNGKFIEGENKRKIFKLVDEFNKIYNSIKFIDKSDL